MKADIFVAIVVGDPRFQLGYICRSYLHTDYSLTQSPVFFYFYKDNIYYMFFKIKSLKYFFINDTSINDFSVTFIFQ